MLSSENEVSIIEPLALQTNLPISFIVYPDSSLSGFKPFQFFNREWEYFYFPHGDTATIKLLRKQIMNSYLTVSNKVLAVLGYQGKDSLAMQVDGSKLVLIQEGLNAKGEWRPVEYYLFGDCGFAQKQIILKHNNEVKITARKYSGEFKTKLRLKLMTSQGPVFSNEFEGSINYKQFIKPKFPSKYKNNFSFLN